MRTGLAGDHSDYRPAYLDHLDRLEAEAAAASQEEARRREATRQTATQAAFKPVVRNFPAEPSRQLDLLGSLTCAELEQRLAGG